VRFREFVHVSAVGKLLAVLSSLVPWMSGAIPATLPMLFGGDLIFALLFFEYLRRSQRDTGWVRFYGNWEGHMTLEQLMLVFSGFLALVKNVLTSDAASRQ